MRYATASATFARNARRSIPARPTCASSAFSTRTTSRCIWTHPAKPCSSAAGGKPGMVLLDPMCGSGTILAEAAQMLAGIPPGARRSFAFEKFKGFAREEWQAVKGSFKPHPLPAEPTIFGSDISGDMNKKTRNKQQQTDNQFEVPLKQIEAQEIK